MHAAVKADQNTDADAERECQNDPETGRSQWWFGGPHLNLVRCARLHATTVVTIRQSGLDTSFELFQRFSFCEALCQILSF